MFMSPISQTIPKRLFKSLTAADGKGKGKKWEEMLVEGLIKTLPSLVQEIGKGVVKKLMKDKEKSPEEKISELRRLKELGEITEEEFKELKKKVLEAYANSW